MFPMSLCSYSYKHYHTTRHCDPSAWDAKGEPITSHYVVARSTRLQVSPATISGSLASKLLGLQWHDLLITPSLLWRHKWHSTSHPFLYSAKSASTHHFCGGSTDEILKLSICRFSSFPCRESTHHTKPPSHHLYLGGNAHEILQDFDTPLPSCPVLH